MAITDSNAEILLELERQCAQYESALLSENTKLNYSEGWNVFERWAGSMGLTSLPAEPKTVKLFVASLLARGRKVTTARARVAAIRRCHLNAKHPSPVTQDVRDVLRGARRSRDEQPSQALPLTVPELRRICERLLADNVPIAMRNRAILLTQFTGALRNSTTAFLLLSDVTFPPEGALLKIRRSKTDQEGRGTDRGLPHGKHHATDVVGALKEWIAERGTKPGPLFTRFDGSWRNRHLEPERVGQIVQDLANSVGVETTGHGLRAGFCSEAGNAGASDLNIGAQAGMKSMETVRRYVRKRNAFVANPMALLDL